MQDGIDKSTRTIAVLSNDYLTSVYGTAEWQAALALDPAGTWRKLLVVRVADCPRRGLLAGVVGVGLFGLDDTAATAQLRAMIKATLSGRAKPSVKPAFPGAKRAVPREPQFPGPKEEQAVTPSNRGPHKTVDEATSFGNNRKAVMVNAALGLVSLPSDALGVPPEQNIGQTGCSSLGKETLRVNYG